jgi:hypothetical protein
VEQAAQLVVPHDMIEKSSAHWDPQTCVVPVHVKVHLPAWQDPSAGGRSEQS